MNREIKFRGWTGKEMHFFDLYTVNTILFEKQGGSMLIYDSIKQYTGLKDKNGNEIYGGDILSKRWKVEVYQNEEGTWMIRFHTNPNGNKPKSLLRYLESRKKAGTSEEDNEIIGNIYETPNLLTP